MIMLNVKYYASSGHNATEMAERLITARYVRVCDVFYQPYYKSRHEIIIIIPTQNTLVTTRYVLQVKMFTRN